MNTEVCDCLYVTEIFLELICSVLGNHSSLHSLFNNAITHWG